MDLATVIAGRLPTLAPCALRTGRVVSHAGGRIQLSVGGGTVTEVPYLASYSPAVSDTVQVLQTASGLLVLGKIA